MSLRDMVRGHSGDGLRLDSVFFSYLNDSVILCLLVAREGLEFCSILEGRECKQNIPKHRQLDSVIMSFRWISEVYVYLI